MLHLSAAVDQPSAYDAASYLTLARLAERGGLDFVTLEDSFARPGLDALAVLARLAPATSRIGLVPTVTTTHTEPFHVQAAVATLDWVSRGRAGWRIDVSTTEGEARLFGRRHAASAGELWQEAGEAADVAAKLWDSWEDDAEIRDVPTGRFIDRDKLHHVDFRGTSFSVKGPSIVPRPRRAIRSAWSTPPTVPPAEPPPGTPTWPWSAPRAPLRPPPYGTNSVLWQRISGGTPTSCGSSPLSSSTSATASTRQSGGTAGAAPGRPRRGRSTAAAPWTSRN